MRHLLGLDIGGTKCAAFLGRKEEDGVRVLGRREIATAAHPGPDRMIPTLAAALDGLLAEHSLALGDIAALGISCGGPLDSRRGIILGPPNLPGWDHVPIVAGLTDRLEIPVFLQNDANACALAEWRWGAGRGTRHMVFLTFGTGMGAGLILNGELYSGANDQGGEVGHVRLAEDGPEGYGKRGSFEGFCSGGGIARLAQELVDSGTIIPDGPLPDPLTARSIAAALDGGAEWARAVYAIVARRLGQGLSILIDVLNPEVIVIGSIYARRRDLLDDIMWSEIRHEALPLNREACRIVPASLGESLGDLACLSVALDGILHREKRSESSC